jgi:hypothetical protein
VVATVDWEEAETAEEEAVAGLAAERSAAAATK